MSSDYLVKMTTTRVGSMVKLIEAMKDVVTEVTFRCIPVMRDDDGKIMENSGVEIVEYDKTKELMMVVKMGVNQFEEYEVNTVNNVPVMITMEVSILAKILKSLSTDNMFITFGISKNDTSKFLIEMANRAGEKRNIAINRLVKNGMTMYGVPVVEYDVRCTILTTRFHRSIRDKGAYAELVNITYVKNATMNILELSCRGDYVANDTETINVEKNDNNDDGEDILVNGSFDIKTLCFFLKFGAQSDVVNIYMKRGGHFIYEYSFADLARVRFYLAQRNTNSNIAVTDSDDDKNDDDE